MLLCRGVRLSVAPLDQALKSSGLARFNAPGPRRAAWSPPHNKYVLLHEGRSPFTSTAHLDGEKPSSTVKHGDPSSRFITADFKRFNRRATIMSDLPSRGVHRASPGAAHGDTERTTPRPADRCPGVTAGGAVGRVLFRGGATLRGTPGCSPSTVTPQTRALSTHTREKDPGETDHKGEEQHSKESLTSPSSSSSSSLAGMEPEGGRPTKAQQLKKVFKEYGAVGVSFHVCMSLMSLGMFYLLVSSGIDMTAVLCKLGFSEAVVQSKMAAGTSTFVLAYAVHKLFAPMRISITLVCVPLIVRYFRRTGLFKPPSP